MQADQSKVSCFSHSQDVESSLIHSGAVESVISGVLAPGTLRALQIAAVFSSPCINISSLAASGLQHLALACETIMLDRNDCIDKSPPVPSMNLITWVRPCGPAWY